MLRQARQARTLGARGLVVGALDRRGPIDAAVVAALRPRVPPSCALLLTVALLATVVAARRATRIDPIVALRGE